MPNFFMILWIATSFIIGCSVTAFFVTRRSRNLMAEHYFLSQKYQELQTTLQNTDTMLQKERLQSQDYMQKTTALTEGLKHTQQKIENLTQEKQNAEHHLFILQERFYAVQLEKDTLITELTEKNKYLLEKAEARTQDLAHLQQEFSNKFENLANRIFDDKSKIFEERSLKSLTQTLSPVNQSFHDFKQKIEETFQKHRDEQISLKTTIAQVVDINRQMTLQTENLTKALKGDNKIQGNWGEMILTRILEETGLVKGRDYTLQGEGLNLKDDETGKRQQPDVIVHLPDEKHIIIDSKLSLVDYERYITADTEEGCLLSKKAFLNSIRNHVKDLASKRYQDNSSLGTPDFVLMFMPIEGAYSFAMQSDPDLHHFAWEKRIVIVCTSTLFATLRTVASIWKLEHQNRNVQDIADEAGKLYDKFVGFLEDMESIGKNIVQTEKAYKGAMVKLSEGKGNIIKRFDTLKFLGAKTSKDIKKDIKSLALEELGE